MKKSSHQNPRLNPELILFGGTFDPPHKGHSDCVKFVKESFPEAKIAVLPSFQVPLTKDQNKIMRTSFEDRFEMCNRAFEKVADYIWDFEKNLSTPSYTVNLLNYIQKQFPQKHLGFLMGLDQLRKFSTWYEPIKILKLASLIVISRQTEEWESVLKEFSHNLHITIQKNHASFIDIPPYFPLFKMNKETTAISSTQLRELLNLHVESAQNFLDSEVFRYIIEKKLYAD